MTTREARKKFSYRRGNKTLLDVRMVHKSKTDRKWLTTDRIKAYIVGAKLQGDAHTPKSKLLETLLEAHIRLRDCPCTNPKCENDDVHRSAGTPFVICSTCKIWYAVEYMMVQIIDPEDQLLQRKHLSGVISSFDVTDVEIAP